MTLYAAPSAEAQLNFLSKLQRLFSEGDFTATYKFALLISLAELAVEKGADDGAGLLLTTRQIADRFIQLYWRHAAPYSTGKPGAAPGVLVQNTGSQAAVLTAIGEFRSSAPSATVAQARLIPEYGRLLTKVAAVVSAQPINYLQNFSGIKDPFLYERSGAGGVLLKPGIPYCLRRFLPLVQQLSRTHWVQHIKRNRQNQGILGIADDLEDFLFSTSRQALAIVGAGLRKLDGAKCFYCRDSLDLADVDHFIPFSLYARDVAHNFVLAHPRCNRSKSDSLAARPHLERWLDRLAARSDQLNEIGTLAGFASDAATAHRVAEWGYANASVGGGHAWLRSRDYEVVNEGYLTLIARLRIVVAQQQSP